MSPAPAPHLDVAYHEAGHAVVAVRLRLGLNRIELRGRDGRTLTTLPHNASRRHLRARRVCFTLAGELAQQLFRPGYDWLGCFSDRVWAASELGHDYRGGSHRRYFTRKRRVLRPWQAATRLLLLDDWGAVVEIAELLHARAAHGWGEVAGDEVREICRTQGVR